MRMQIAATVATLLAGCHLPCGGCAEWETCAAATQSCALNSGALFDLIAADGNVSYADRNLFQGVPNPKVCVTVSGEECTVAKTLTASPTWNQTLFTALDGAALLAAPLPMRFVDDEPFGNSVDICTGSVTVVEKYLHDEGFRFGCSNGSYANIQLRNVARGTPAPDGGT